MEISKKKRIFGSWWVLLSFIMFFCGLGLIFAGVRTKYKKWTISGLIYMISSWVSVSFGAFGIFLVIWVISIAHTIYIRKEYFMRLKILQDSKEIIEAQRQHKDKELFNKMYKDILGEDKHNIYNTIESNSSEKLEEKKSEKLNKDIKEIQKLDINTCSDAELSQIPGIGIILSKKAMDVKREQGGFTSMDEFYEILNISSEKKNKLDLYLECVVDKSVKELQYEEDNKASEAKNKSMGRKIDF